ncbi:ubiquinol-cytochrome c reductase core subunit 1, partial [Tulasnella sp. 408]
AHDAAAVKTAAVGVAKAISDVKAGSLAGDSFNVAVAKARFRLASQLEERASQVTTLGSKLFGGAQGSLESLSSVLEKTDASAFSKAAVLSSKATYVAIGDVGSLPYADELGL